MEAAGGLPALVPVRDSKVPALGHLSVPAASWRVLTAALSV
ncbi:DUF397 domain-containing protein [Streptomyces sp. SID3343]